MVEEIHSRDARHTEVSKTMHHLVSLQLAENLSSPDTVEQRYKNMAKL